MCTNHSTENGESRNNSTTTEREIEGLARINYNVPQQKTSRSLQTPIHSNRQITQSRGKERIEEKPREDSRLLRYYHQLCNMSQQQLLIQKMVTNIEMHDIQRTRQYENTSTTGDTYMK